VIVAKANFWAKKTAITPLPASKRNTIKKDRAPIIFPFFSVPILKAFKAPKFFDPVLTRILFKN
jgi:hypothetical protein